MTDHEPYGKDWAREIERRFQFEVASRTGHLWTRQRIEGLEHSHGLTLRWQSNALCFVSHPQGLEGVVALRVGEIITDAQIEQLDLLKRLASPPPPFRHKDIFISCCVSRRGLLHTRQLENPSEGPS